MDLRDPETIREIYGRYARGIFNYACRLVGDYQWAEEILQETFLRAFTRAETFRQGAQVSTWLYRIAMNLCYDHLRSPRNRPKVSLSARSGEGDDVSDALSDRMEASEVTPYEGADRSERARIVNEALKELTDRERSVVVLRLMQGMKFREIAKKMGLTSRTVQNCLRRAREKLARSLTRSGLRPEEVLKP